MGTTVKHPMPNWVKPSFVIFDIRALWRSDVKNFKWRLNPVWHSTLYTCSCTHRATVGVKGLTVFSRWKRLRSLEFWGFTQKSGKPLTLWRLLLPLYR